MAVNKEFKYSPKNIVELDEIREKSGSALEPPQKKTTMF